MLRNTLERRKKMSKEQTVISAGESTREFYREQGRKEERTMILGLAYKLTKKPSPELVQLIRAMEARNV